MATSNGSRTVTNLETIFHWSVLRSRYWSLHLVTVGSKRTAVISLHSFRRRWSMKKEEFHLVWQSLTSFLNLSPSPICSCFFFKASVAMTLWLKCPTNFHAAAKSLLITGISNPHFKHSWSVWAVQLRLFQPNSFSKIILSEQITFAAWSCTTMDTLEVILKQSEISFNFPDISIPVCLSGKTDVPKT